MYENDKELLERLRGIAPGMSPNRVSDTLYAQQMTSDRIQARRDVAYRLLSEFNQFCESHGGIEYFAIAQTLEGAVVYKDFIPGSFVFEIGMLRNEYLRLEEAYYAEGGINGIALNVSGSDPDPDKGFRFDEETQDSFFTRAALEAIEDEELDELGNPDELVAPITNVKVDADGSLYQLDIYEKSDIFVANDDRVDEISDNAPAEMAAIQDTQLKRLISQSSDESSLYGGMVSDEEDTYRYMHPKAFKLPIALTTHQDLQKRYHVRRPSVRLPGYCLAKSDGKLLYGENHMPVRISMVLVIVVFDNIPDDYDSARFLYRRLKNVGKTLAALPQRISGRAGIALVALRNRLRDYQWRLADMYNESEQFEAGGLVPMRTRTAPVSDLRPTRMIDFGPTKIMVPNKTRAWIEEDADAQIKQVKQLQHDALEIIKEIDRICRANDIGYFVCGGTMLGYVRHGGFIPWDDDMDIGMLRADYDKFLEVAGQQLDSSRFFLQTRESDPNIPYLFSKVRMKDSQYITRYNEFRNFDKGICVDLFPFDKAPYELGELDAFKAELRKLMREHNKRANRQVGDMPSVPPKNLYERFAREVMTVRHEYYWSKSLAESQNDYTQAVTAYNDVNGLNYVASFNPTFTMVHLNDLLPYKDIDFEGVKLKAPAHPEVFLQMQYGNYMTEPMPHQQQGHGLLWWSDPECDAGDFGVERIERVAPEHHVSLTSKVLKYAGPASAAVALAVVSTLAIKRFTK